MNEEPIVALPHDDAEILELGIALGQNYAFGMVAGRCSAAQAEAIRRLREEKLYKHGAQSWNEFCPKYLKISRVEADRTIKLLEEFGPAYFEVSQLTRVSAETFRAIAPAIRDGALHFNGEAIELKAENSRKVAAAVAEMRSAMRKPSRESLDFLREFNAVLHEADVQERIGRLGKFALGMVAEFEKIARDQRLGLTRSYFAETLARVRDEMVRVSLENGLT